MGIRDFNFFIRGLSCQKFVLKYFDRKVIAGATRDLKFGVRLAKVYPAHGRLIVDGSTTWRITPARAYKLSVLHEARHRGVAFRVGKHLSAPGAIILSVVINKRNSFGVVMVPCLLAIGTARLGVNN
jgi:hypothetical protein